MSKPVSFAVFHGLKEYGGFTWIGDESGKRLKVPAPSARQVRRILVKTLNYGIWAADLQSAVDASLLGFLERNGYEPEENKVLLAEGSGHAHTSFEPPIADFFEIVAEVSLPDVWNGYFVGPEDVYAPERWPRKLRGPDGVALEVSIFGGDGGGSHYALGPQGAIIIDNGSIVGGELVGSARFVAASFDDFLELLLDNVQRLSSNEKPAF